MGISVPFDGPAPGRRQYSFVDVALAHAMTGVGLGAFEQVSPSAYVVRGSWPTPPASNGGFSGAVAASAAEPEVPRSSAQARAIWPGMR
jgi:hypothetical protein